MFDAPRQKSPSSRAAIKKRKDQGSASKARYKIRRKPALPSVYQPEGNGKLNDEQLAMAFVLPRRVEAQPFLKWVGGKGGILPQLEAYFPRELDRYIEPFIGGGAVFFHLKHRFPEMRALLRDSNQDLIQCYRVVRDRPEDLMRRLDEHARAFRGGGSDYYYQLRQQHDLADELDRAARMIFLNKTCFNGLWRVNARGEFNTPVGANQNAKLYDRDNLLAASAALQGAELEAQDFRRTVAEARKGDFVYCDPPYFPVSVYSDFKRYTAGQFREADQVDLARGFRELADKGCRVVLSNSEHPRIRGLYAGFSIRVVSAPRFINCKPGGRGNVSELVVANTDLASQPRSRLTSPAEPEFPETKYMGSKQRLLPFILKNLAGLKFGSALDAFSGSGCVGYALKRTGARVYANDFLNFCFHTARATIENNTTRLTDEDVGRLVRPNARAASFVRDTYADLYFDRPDCEFLDQLRANVAELESPLKSSLALAAAARACMKKRPRGMFTFTGRKGWDGRKDLKLSMREQFLAAVAALNGAVCSNGQQNKAFNVDVFDLPPGLADLVYIDTPYISPFSDCDYTRRYHFVEGFCRNWSGLKLTDTTTRKFASYDTEFSTKARASRAFQKMFHHFRQSTLVVSYSSNCIPGKAEMLELLKNEKSKVTVYESAHRYHHGNHAHKVGHNNNEVVEYLFIAE